MAFTDLLGDLGNLANPFGASSQGQWNLSRGIYTTKVSNKSIIFFYETPKGENRTQRTAVDQITDSGSRRLAVYKYPYRDGQRVTDLGRDGETFTFNIKFHGDNYQTKFQEFLDVVVNSNEQGTLVHPVRSASTTQGALTVRFHTWEFLHRFDEWNAVTIKATFIEDNTDALVATNKPRASQDTALRSALQFLTSTQAAISNAIFQVGALAGLPSSIMNAMNQRLTSLTGQVSRLLGQLATTFSSSAQLKQMASQSANLPGGMTSLSSGQVAGTAGVSTASSLPPVYQAGFDPATQAQIQTQLQAFVSANQITPQQAVFQANQARASISAAIAEIETNLGNDGYDIMVQYRALAVQIQQAVESSIAQTQSLVKVYTLPSPMSLRMIAKANGLTADDQNAIEALNPYLSSVNYLPTGTQITVPAA